MFYFTNVVDFIFIPKIIFLNSVLTFYRKLWRINEIRNKYVFLLETSRSLKKITISSKTI